MDSVLLMYIVFVMGWSFLLGWDLRSVNERTNRYSRLRKEKYALHIGLYLLMLLAATSVLLQNQQSAIKPHIPMCKISTVDGLVCPVTEI